VEFSNGGYKIRNIFAYESTYPKEIIEFLSFGLMASCQKVPKFDFESQFSMSKSFESFSIFFSLKNTNLGAQFLLLTFFDKTFF
jgi:hypothetical protein